MCASGTPQSRRAGIKVCIISAGAADVKAKVIGRQHLSQSRDVDVAPMIVIATQVVGRHRARVADVELHVWVGGVQLLHLLPKRVFATVTKTGKHIGGLLGPFMRDRVRHAQNRRDTNTSTDEHHGRTVGRVKKKRALRRLHIERGFGLDTLVKKRAALAKR